MPTDELQALATLDAGPVLFYTPQGHSVPLETFYQGRACFLTLSGPSLADANLDLLRGPGIVTLGVNNSWSVFRPRLWTCADPCDRFCFEGWMDPAITKLVPMQLANVELLRRASGDTFTKTGIRAKEAPAVFLFQRNVTFEPADFMVQSSVNWGQHDKHPCGVGIHGCKSVMMQALRLALALGFRTINLVGADFTMTEEKPYAFEESKDERAARSNNKAYRILARRFEALYPVLAMNGVRVRNCTPGSSLKVFPFLRLSDAVAEASEHCKGPMVTRGCYGKKSLVSSGQVPPCSTSLPASQATTPTPSAGSNPPAA